MFLKRAGDMVSIDKETAASCLYSRPVGKERGQMKFAQGESIRLAEIVAATYGNLRVGAIISEMTPRYVKAVGMAHDLENNYGVKAEVVESTVNKHGVPYSERMRLVTAKAAQSKAIRDAIFRVVPRSLIKPIADTAREVALGKGQTMSERRQGVLDWLNEIGVDADRAYLALGIEGIEELTKDHLIILTGVFTAVKDGDITVDEAFPPLVIEEGDSKKGLAGLKDKLSKRKKNGDPEPTKDEPDPDFEKKKAEQLAALKSEADETFNKPEGEIWHCTKCNHPFTPEESTDEDGQCPKCFCRVISKPEK